MLNRLFPQAVLITEKNHPDYGRVGFLSNSAYCLSSDSGDDERMGYRIWLVPEKRQVVIPDSRKEPTKFIRFRSARNLKHYLEK